MIHRVSLPNVGPAFSHLAVERWLKEEGDAVAPGDILCEVAADKAILQVEASHAGTLLAILVPAGRQVPAGTVVAVIGQAGEKVPASLLAQAGKHAERPAPAAKGIVPLSPMRRIIADRMLQSRRTIPAYYLEIDADVTDLVALRSKLGDKAAGVKVTFNDLLVQACGMALAAFPVVNSRWVEGAGIERRRQVNVGFAVALNEGLLVPVVRDVDKKSVQRNQPRVGRPGGPRPHAQVAAGGTDRGLHEHHEPGHLRHQEFHPHHQPRREHDPGHRHDRRAAGRPSGRDPGPQDHEHDPGRRPPPDRRLHRGTVS